MMKWFPTKIVLTKWVKRKRWWLGIQFPSRLLDNHLWIFTFASSILISSRNTFLRILKKFNSMQTNKPLVNIFRGFHFYLFWRLSIFMQSLQYADLDPKEDKLWKKKKTFLISFSTKNKIWWKNVANKLAVENGCR